MTAFRRLFEPLVIGNFTVRNRIVNTTHGTGLGDVRDLRYLQERARGGAGLLGVHTHIYRADRDLVRPCRSTPG